ncbi:MAG: NOL1/NOP2/sun family putative RNA methylase [Bacilli bacterium]|nr:NOL1/NOP2/sun family putative RNA methylase [Bacilli bacterium]
MEFLEHLKSYLSEEEIAKLDNSLNNKSEHALLLNVEKMNEETLLSIYPSLKRHPVVKNAFIYDKDELDLGKSIYHELGCFYLQEPSAMLPAYLLDPKPGDLVLDLCAAPGGKSMQASLLMKNEGLIISNDISKSRTFSIVENAERLGRGNLLITNNDFSSIYTKFINTFDKIILDAPCSGSGMFRKEDKMKEDWSYQKVLKNAEIQKSLILMSYQMLKPGGVMVYSTCSFSYEEDEEVVDYLLNNSDATLLDILDSPLLYKNKNNNKGIHLLPFLFPGEGHYIALIKKPGEPIQKNDKKYYQKQEKFGDYLFTLSETFSIKHLNVVRYGVKIGQVDKNDIRYDYHYARFVKDFVSTKEIYLKTLLKYYQGETINEPIAKGYVLLQYKGINVDIAKSDGRMIKNRLPKGLRKKLIA